MHPNNLSRHWYAPPISNQVKWMVTICYPSSHLDVIKVPQVVMNMSQVVV